MDAKIKEFVASLGDKGKGGGKGGKNGGRGRTQFGKGNGSGNRSRSPSANRPDPKFKGCWFCGPSAGDDHLRGTCAKYKAARAANGNQHVDGAWEKSQKGKAVPVKALASEAGTESEDSEGEEPEGILRKVPGFGLTHKAPTEIKNSFNALQETPSTSTEQLNGWAHRVVMASQQQSQKSRVQKVITVRTEADVEEVMQEFRKRQTVNGLRKSPRFVKIASLEAGQGWKWVMVDSGSGEHCLDAEVELPDHPIERSQGQEAGQTVETAGGHELHNLREV